jgi:1,4-alpha-glucan branching enzyme
VVAFRGLGKPQQRGITMAERSSKKRVSFKLAAPTAKVVYLAGTFNDWDPAARPMKQDTKGIWRTRVSLAPGVHQYRYFVDGEWFDDPLCEDCCENAYGSSNCVVRV